MRLLPARRQYGGRRLDCGGRDVAWQYAIQWREREVGAALPMLLILMLIWRWCGRACACLESLPSRVVAEQQQSARPLTIPCRVCYGRCS